MAPFNNPRIAWGVALAALALWATSVPLTWGQIGADASRMLDVTPTTAVTEAQQTDETTTDSSGTPCPPAPAPAAVAVPTLIASLLPTPIPASAASSGAASQGTFHLCGSDAKAAQDIEQLISGRSFSASLTSAADGCADLTVRATSPVGNGSASSKLSVSLGSGQSLQIQITSQSGSTHVSIGA